MRPFRFRALAALELRRKQEDDARSALGEAERALRVAETQLQSALDTAGQANQQLSLAQTHGATGALIGWHRSWILSCRLVADERRARVADAAAAVEQRAQVVRDAHRKRRTLERFRDRAWRKYQADAGREEQRDMNGLAGMRYLAQAADHGDEHRDNRHLHDELQRGGDDTSPDG
jgi:flagellar export protein FliJ